VTERSDEPPDPIERMQQAWRRERPGTDVDAMGILTRVRYIAKLLDDDQRRALAHLDIDVSTRDLLSTLRRAGRPYRLSPGEIARQSLLTPGAVTQRIARAERQDLVRRLPDDSDGRGVVVELTASGHDLVEATLDALVEHEQRLLSGISASEREQLESGLRQLLATVRRNTNEPR
jgi:DNA-binding MarR family transcriptional regulator